MSSCRGSRTRSKRMSQSPKRLKQLRIIEEGRTSAEPRQWIATGRRPAPGEGGVFQAIRVLPVRNARSVENQCLKIVVRFMRNPFDAVHHEKTLMPSHWPAQQSSSPSSKRPASLAAAERDCRTNHHHRENRGGTLGRIYELASRPVPHQEPLRSGCHSTREGT